MSKLNLSMVKARKESPASRIDWIVRIPSSILLPPSYVQLESTTKCNMRCKTCIRSAGENFDMPFDFFKSIIDQLQSSRFGTQQVDLTGVGEPLLNKNLVSMVHYAKRRGFRVGFTTNFTLIDESRARRLIKADLDYLYISIDSARRETFEKLRVGADFEDVVSKVKLFVKIRKESSGTKPTLKLTATLSKDNPGEIPELIKLAETLELNGINFNRQIVPEEEYCENELPTLPMWRQGSGSTISIGRRAIWLKKPQPCVAMKGCFVTYDGRVIPCNGLMQLVPRAKYYSVQMGDLKQNSLDKIWFSSRYRQLRTMLALGIPPDFCRCCPRPYQI